VPTELALVVIVVVVAAVVVVVDVGSMFKFQNFDICFHFV
jgi:Ni/Fe-hydrogenase subunit HybB-like protein